MKKRELKNVEERLKDAEERAKNKEVEFMRKVLDSMSVEDLRALIDDNIPEKQKNEIYERAVHEYKSKTVEKA